MLHAGLFSHTIAALKLRLLLQCPGWVRADLRAMVRVMVKVRVRVRVRVRVDLWAMVSAWGGRL